LREKPPLSKGVSEIVGGSSLIRRAGAKPNQAAVRLGAYYRWLMTTALWPAERQTTRILDLGCHSGFWLHQQTAGCRPRVGCDLEPVALYPDVQYVKCDARKLPFATGSFDLCTAWDVLEHVPDDQTMLRELSRVLRPGGRAKISVPHKYIAAFPPFLTPWLHRRWQHSVRTGYTPSEIQSLAGGNGFSECREALAAPTATRSKTRRQAAPTPHAKPPGTSKVHTAAQRSFPTPIPIAASPASLCRV
jgi:SAM-dependent methyltransferase